MKDKIKMEKNNCCHTERSEIWSTGENENEDFNELKKSRQTTSWKFQDEISKYYQS